MRSTIEPLEDLRACASCGYQFPDEQLQEGSRHVASDERFCNDCVDATYDGCDECQGEF